MQASPDGLPTATVMDAARVRSRAARMHVSLHALRRFGLLLAACAAALVAVGSLALPAGGAPSTDALRDQIDRQSGQEDQLASAADRPGALEQRASRAVDLMQGRLDAKQGDLDTLQAKLERDPPAAPRPAPAPGPAACPPGREPGAARPGAARPLHGGHAGPRRRGPQQPWLLQLVERID